MAAGRLAAPGTEAWPCVDGDCGHTDCHTTRKMAIAACRICGEVIGYDKGFYEYDRKTLESGYVLRCLVHSVCLENAEGK